MDSDMKRNCSLLRCYCGCYCYEDDYEDGGGCGCCGIIYYEAEDIEGWMCWL